MSSTALSLAPPCSSPFNVAIPETIAPVRSALVEAVTRVAKVEALKEYRNDALVSILIWNFDETVVSLMPEGDVPFTPNESPLGTDHTSLRRESKNLYHFVKGGNDTLNGIRRETMFIQMLEGLHPDEARIIILVKDKRLSDEYAVTYDQVKEAYPDINWGGRS